MGLASCIVEISFDDPASASSFTDVSSYVRSVQTNRGRSSELENAEAGTCVVRLDNRDRRFDPTYSSGPYYPDLAPMKVLRVRGVFGGDDVAQFYGFIESITQTWDGNDAVAEIRAVDVFKLLALERMPDREDYPSVVERIMEPWGYWRLNGKASTKVVPGGKVRVGQEGKKKWTRKPVRKVKEMAGLAGPTALVVGSPAFEQAAGTDSITTGPIPGEITYGMQFTSTTSYLRVPITDGDERPGNPGNAIAISFLAYFTTTTINGAVIISGPDYGSTDGAWRITTPILSGSDRTFRLVVEHSDGTNTTVTGTTAITTGTWYHVFACWRGDTGVGQLFVFGQREAVTTSGAKTMRRGTAGNPMWIAKNGPSGTTFNNAILADVVIGEQKYANSSTLPEASELYLAARGGGVGGPAAFDDSGNRLIDLVTVWAAGMPDTACIGASGAGTDAAQVGPQRLDGSSRLDMMRKVEEAEGGYLFARRNDSRIWFLTRSYSPSITYTFGDSTGELPYTEIAGMDYSDEPLFNVVRVTREDGITQTREDATSITTYLARVLDITDTIHSTDAEADELAVHLLAKFKDPGVRIRDLTVAGHASDALWPAILNLDLGDRITVKRRPPGGGSAISLNVRIEGIAHTVEGRTWTTRYSLSPSP